MFVLRVRTTALQYMRYIRNVHETPFAYLHCVVRRTGAGFGGSAESKRRPYSQPKPERRLHHNHGGGIAANS